MFFHKTFELAAQKVFCCCVILPQVVQVRKYQHLQVLRDLLVSSQRFHQEPYPCKSFPEAVLAIVDVEAEGAGDGEGQVGDDADHLQPGGPRYVLQL